MEQPQEIHLAKPSGRKEGPFSLNEINLALAAGRYRSGDYWAWHKGLEQWVPLYDIKGIINVSSLAVGLAKETPERPNLQEKSPAGEMAEVPTPLLVGLKDVAGVEHPASPPSELPKLVFPESSAKDSPDIPKTEEPLASIARPVVQNAEPQAMGTTAEGIQAASPDPEPSEALAPLSDNDGSELSKDQADEFVGPDGPIENLAEELPASGPEAGSSDSAFEDPFPNLPECDPAETEQEAAEAPQEPEEQTTEPITESFPSHAQAVESLQEAVPDPAPCPPLEPLPDDEPSKVSKEEGRDLVEKAETAATILARLKQSFFHSPEPANGVTSYFNARRAPLPGMAESGTPPLGEEWGMPEASHPLDFHSKAVPKVPEEGSSPGPETDPAAALLAQQFSSGMPFAALEQLFVFTTGGGRAIWNSPIMSRMLEAIVGEKMERIRQGTPRDVIFNCDLSKLLKRDGAISDSVWHAMEIREPTVVARAQKKLSRTCVRTFNLEMDTVVALVLFYNIQKLENGSPALGASSSGTTRFTLPVNVAPSGSEHPR
jgi:hypothetical protein